MESTWETRDLPVLQAIVEITDREGPGPGARVRDIAETTGLSLDDVKRATYALEGAYIGPLRRSLGGDGGQWRVTEVYPGARVITGQWPNPDTLANRLVSALEQMAAHGDTPEEAQQGPEGSQ